MFRSCFRWAFFFAAASFICALAATVANISLYIKRFTHLEDMSLIIPGLDKRGGYEFSKTEDLESENLPEPHNIVL